MRARRSWLAGLAGVAGDIAQAGAGSCHGLTLAGGLGPALTVEALAQSPSNRDALIATVLSGRRGTAMPPFSSLLDESEAIWIVDELLRGFPPDPGPQPAR